MSVAAAGADRAAVRQRRGLLITLLAISVLLNLGFVVGAAWTWWHAPAFGAAGFEQRYRRIASELDLDPQQQQAFDKYLAAMRGRFDNVRRQVGPLIGAAWAELAKPQADGAQALRLFGEAADKRRELQREAAAQTVEFLSVLSPAQRSKFVAIAGERRGAWGRH